MSHDERSIPMERISPTSQPRLWSLLACCGLSIQVSCVRSVDTLELGELLYLPISILRTRLQSRKLWHAVTRQ